MKKEDGDGDSKGKKGECTAVFFPLRCHIGFCNNTTRIIQDRREKMQPYTHKAFYV